MSKNFIFKLLVGLVILIAPVLWLLSMVVPDTFGWFNASYAVALLSAGVGVLFILKGAFKKDTGTFKKANIWFGIGLLVITLFSLVSAIAIPKNYIVPIICILVACGLVLGIIVTGGKKWDEGNNEKVGYKNYHQRKTDEEMAEKDDNK